MALVSLGGPVFDGGQGMACSCCSTNCLSRILLRDYMYSSTCTCTCICAWLVFASTALGLECGFLGGGCQSLVGRLWEALCHTCITEGVIHQIMVAVTTSIPDLGLGSNITTSICN